MGAKYGIVNISTRLQRRSGCEKGDRNAESGGSFFKKYGNVFREKNANRPSHLVASLLRIAQIFIPAPFTSTIKFLRLVLNHVFIYRDFETSLFALFGRKWVFTT